MNMYLYFILSGSPPLNKGGSITQLTLHHQNSYSKYVASCKLRLHFKGVPNLYIILLQL